MHAHNIAVADIASHVKSFHENDSPFRIYHGSSHTVRPIHFDKDKIIDISTLSNTLSVNEENRTAIVEPCVSMSELVQETLLKKLMPAVVPDIETITAGGAFAGTAAESSSFKYGYFYQIVNWIEVVLGNGDIVTASPTENADLFYGSAGAMGSLGIITLLEVQLVPCKHYIKVEYVPVDSFQEAVQQLDLLATTDIDFLDGLMFSENVGMIVTGTLVGERPQKMPVIQFTKPGDRWFFAHVYGKAKCPKGDICGTCSWTDRPGSMAYIQKDETVAELLPIAAFLFRYHRGTFWLGAYKRTSMLRHSVTRTMLSPFLKKKSADQVIQKAGHGQKYLIQDFAVPEDKAVNLLSFLEPRLKVYPLWLCPIRYSSQAPMLRQKETPRYLINVRVWGVPEHTRKPYKSGTNRFRNDNIDLKVKLVELGGTKWLYAQNFFHTENAFWQAYDKEAYDGLRKQWAATTIPSVWEKIK